MPHERGRAWRAPPCLYSAARLSICELSSEFSLLRTGDSQFVPIPADTPVATATLSSGTLDYAVHDPDVQLMLDVRSDDASAFERLVCRYQTRLISVLELLVGNSDQAEDLAQEVFLRVYRARKTYQPKAKFCTWLFAIANNVASNARRATNRRRTIGGTASGHFQLAGDSCAELTAPSGCMPTRLLDKAEQIAHVRQAIRLLNERQRTALLLCKFEDLSYTEIAELMQTTPKAVKSLLARARSNLRDLLEPYVEHGSHLPAELAAAGRDE